MSRAEKEGALSRWSRLKIESTHANKAPEKSTEPVAANPDKVVEKSGETQSPGGASEAVTDLPSLDELGTESDFSGFMDPRVDDNLRRAALKKLFLDPDFNVTDGLDVYAEDYTNLETMTPAMVAGLKHAQRLLFGDADKKANDTQQANTQEHSAEEQEQTILPGEAREACAKDDDPVADEPANSEKENGAELTSTADTQQRKVWKQE